MKKYINTSNYYLSTTTSKIENTGTSGTFDVSDVTVDWVTLPLTGYYWVDVDFGDSSKREIFRIVSRSGYTLTYDDRISPYGMKTHQSWASVGLRDFSQLLNSLSTNTDNFWEVEKTGDLSILVRGGNVFLSGSAKADTWVKEISSKPFDLQANTVTYIVVDIDEILYSFAAITNTDYLLNEWQYPIAKITTGTSAITEIKDLRSTMIGGWDMRSAVYDPEWKRKELYLMDNMEQSEDGLHLFVTQSQVDLWNSYQETKQDLLVSSWTWQNIIRIDWNPIVWNDILTYRPSWNIALKYSLSANYFYETTGQWITEYTLEHEPLDENSFIVYTNSWTVLIKWVDYTVVHEVWSHTYKIEFAVEQETESYVLWILSRDWAPLNIWNWEITINQWWEMEWEWLADIITFSVNQTANTTVNLQKSFIMTQDDYNAMSTSDKALNNFYFIKKQ